MSPTGIAQMMPLLSGGEANSKKGDDPAKVRDAAQQFEALLIGQMLRSVRESGGGWLGSGGGDSTSDCATEYAEQQFAAALSQHGGLGMADLISKGLAKGH
ncbi:MAG TPA: hypothetical protein VKU19_35005 [Bryobacteraceae bacterium]|nr:hypothetical protein [Bryobacteraceae bacterium]